MQNNCKNAWTHLRAQKHSHTCTVWVWCVSHRLLSSRCRRPLCLLLACICVCTTLIRVHDDRHVAALAETVAAVNKSAPATRPLDQKRGPRTSERQTAAATCCGIMCTRYSELLASQAGNPRLPPCAETWGLDRKKVLVITTTLALDGTARPPTVDSWHKQH